MKISEVNKYKGFFVWGILFVNLNNRGKRVLLEQNEKSKWTKYNFFVVIFVVANKNNLQVIFLIELKFNKYFKNLWTKKAVNYLSANFVVVGLVVKLK